jgi:hypothetical protein
MKSLSRYKALDINYRIHTHKMLSPDNCSCRFTFPELASISKASGSSPTITLSFPSGLRDVCCANRRISYYNYTAKSKMNSPSLLNASTQEIKKYPDNSILSRKVAPKTGKYTVESRIKDHLIQRQGHDMDSNERSTFCTSKA